MMSDFNSTTQFWWIIAAWYEKRKMKKIYSPLLEGLLALYLGFEWIQVTLVHKGPFCYGDS